MLLFVQCNLHLFLIAGNIKVTHFNCFLHFVLIQFLIIYKHLISPLVETTRTDVSPTFNSCKKVSLCTCHKCSVRAAFFGGRSAYITKKSQPVWHKYWLNLVFKQEFVKKWKRKKTKSESFFRLKLMHVTSNKNLLIYILSCVNLWKNVLYKFGRCIKL